ncbi:MAG: peroxiredoxin family protein [Thiotrichales bacterium]
MTKKPMLIRVLYSVLLFCCLPAEAANPKYSPEDNQLWLALPTHEMRFGDEVYPVQVIKPDENSRRLYLWINEPYPANNGDAIVSAGLKKSGEIWFIDIADALFMTRDKTGYRNLSGAFLLPVLQSAFEKYDEVVIISSDVSSVPVLRALRMWRAKAPPYQRDKLKDVVLMFPSLYVNTPQAGQSRELFPIASMTALPISIIQPERGAQANTITEVARALIEGGSLVDIHRVPRGADGYYRYQDITKNSQLTARLIPELVDKKAKIARQIQYHIPAAPEDSLQQRAPVSHKVSGIRPLEEPVKMSNIQLSDFQGKPIDVAKDYAGKTLLINFWATWCPPCVEEIPSMNAALQQLEKENFAIVSISFKDPVDDMKKFVEKIPVHFPVLMDLDGKVSQQWKVFTFPSSFLVDAQGYIRYSINAGHRWDAPDAIEQIKVLSNLEPVAPQMQ